MGKPDYVTDFRTFRAEVMKELSLRGWKYTDLARESGYSVSYVRLALANIQGSPKIAKRIVDVLGLPEHLAS